VLSRIRERLANRAGHLRQLFVTLVVNSVSRQRLSPDDYKGIQLTGETRALSEFCPGLGQDWAQTRRKRVSKIVDISDSFPL